MMSWRCRFSFLFYALMAALVLRAATYPPLLTTTVTTTVDSGGRPWAYVTLGENQPGLVAGRRLAVYSKTGPPASTNGFSTRGPIAASDDPGVIQVQLGRAADIGDNLAALEAQMIALHRWLLNTHNSLSASTNQPPAMPLNQRLAALTARAAGDQRLAQMLDLYGLTHPALRLVRGTAWAGPLAVSLGAPVTLEIREQDGSGQDVSVIGRVTVLAGQPEILATPTPIVVVPDLSSSGDLNVKLRWATPDDLRHASGRHAGDIVWRVTRSFAESHGLDQTPPTGAGLDQMSLSNPADVGRAAGPVYPSRLFEPADVGDFVADSSTSYVTDNNGRYLTNGAPFVEGSQFYYFVAAADALGRPGAASTGVLATVCRRVPPPVPTRVGVVHEWTPSDGQSLDVRWQANSFSNGVATARYEVFRGDNLVQLAAAQRGELDLTAVPIVAGQPLAIQRLGSVNDPGVNPSPTLDYPDDGGGALDKTWWYAVRAVHSGPPGCGDLFSPLSPPVFAALQSRSAPPAPGTNEFMPPEIGCLRVGCINDTPAVDELVASGLDDSVANFVVRCDRRPGVTEVDFQVFDTQSHLLVSPQTGVQYAVGDTTAEFTWTLPLLSSGDTLDVQCAVRAVDGSVSPWTHALVRSFNAAQGHRTAVHFLAGAIEKSDLAAAAPGDPLWTALLNAPAPPCSQDVHVTVSPPTGRVVHPGFCIPLAPGTEQYHVYRRVADGPLTLIGQGLQKYTGPGCAFTFEDPAPPVFNGPVSYFLQLMDEQGRASAMRRLALLQFTGDTPPTPVLLAPQDADFGGTPAEATLNLSWVCPPEHVERFEIFVTSAKLVNEPDQGISAPANSAFRLSVNQLGIPLLFKTFQLLDPVIPAPRVLTVQQSLLTGRVGGDFSPGPRFTIPLKLDPSLNYTVWLRALGPNGEPSEISKTIDFKWKAPPPPQPDIAWPARPLPPVAAFNSGIQVIDFSSVPQARLKWPWGHDDLATVVPDETPVGIRVGTLPFVSSHVSFGIDGAAPSLISEDLKVDPNKQVFSRPDDASQSLLPCVLYRQQVANSMFPQVSGDVIQCSPYLSAIAWISDFVGDGGNNLEATLIDPFFRWLAPDSNSANPSIDLYLTDTQPVIAGAAYRYWLVRFNSGEPVQTVPCGVVTIQSP